MIYNALRPFSEDFVQICKRLARPFIDPIGLKRRSERCARLLQYLEHEAQEELPVLQGKALQRWEADTAFECL